MEECKYCHKMFKRVASHINKCPVKLSMVQCSYCKKLFKRIAAHDYRCPKKPEENNNVDDQVSNKKPCPHCKKMFKRVAAHVYRCPEKPKENGEMSDGISPHEDVDEQVSDQENGATPGRKSLDEKYSNKKVSNRTPCPHCNKMFKRLASHVNKCPQKQKENGEIANEKENEEISNENSFENDSSSEEEVEVYRPAAKPCPHCQKMFKRVSSHINSCPKKPKENGGIEHAETIESISTSEEEDEEYEDEETEDTGEKIGNSATHHFCKSVSTTKTTKTVPKTFIDQSEYKTKYFATPISNSSPKPRGPESERSEPHGKMRLSFEIDFDYQQSPRSKSPTNSNAALSKQSPGRICRTSYETCETESNTSSQISPRKLKRPPIHGNHSLHGIPIVDLSGNEEGSLTDFSEDNSFGSSEGNSFNRSLGSEDSFSYLNKVLKRPPIHKSKSQREANKKQQLPTDEEEEFLEYHRHAARE